MNVGDRVKVINEESSLFGYKGVIVRLNEDVGYSILLDARQFTMHFDCDEVEAV